MSQDPKRGQGANSGGVGAGGSPFLPQEKIVIIFVMVTYYGVYVLVMIHNCISGLSVGKVEKPTFKCLDL